MCFDLFHRQTCIKILHIANTDICLIYTLRSDLIWRVHCKIYPGFFFQINMYDTQLFSSCPLKKIWVEATLKSPDRFCRVPFKSLLRKQIKWASDRQKYLIGDFTQKREEISFLISLLNLIFAARLQSYLSRLFKKLGWTNV